MKRHPAPAASAAALAVATLTVQDDAAEPHRVGFLRASRRDQHPRRWSRQSPCSPIEHEGYKPAFI